MSNLLNMDGKLYDTLYRLGDFIVLNLLFLLCCLPIFTIGTSLTALYTLTIKMVERQESYVVKSFFEAFKENFKQSLGLWAVAVVAILISITDYIIVRQMGNQILKAGVIIIMVLVLFICTYLFPLIAKFSNSNIKSIKNAFIMSVVHWKYTIVMVALNLIPIALYMLNRIFFRLGLFFYLSFGFALTAYINSIMFRKIFEKYIERSDQC